MRTFCDGCGGLFDWPDTVRADARYHSNACRQQAYRLRKKVSARIADVGADQAIAGFLAEGYASIGLPVPEAVTRAFATAPREPFVCGDQCWHEPICPSVTASEVGGDLAQP